jgi:hypothetical protein
MRSIRTTMLLCAGVLGLAGCGLNVQAPDLFVLTRTGEGQKLTMLVNDSGTIRCDGGETKSLPDPLLLQARDVATNLDTDARAGLRIPPSANSVYAYKVTLQDGTITFPDTAAVRHSELAQAEQFALQAGQQVCGLSG